MSSYFNLPFDPTGYTTISGAQLAQLVGGLGPAVNYGFCVVSVDDQFGNPNVPNVDTTPALASFLWLRIGNVSNASATLYIWNPNGAVNITLDQWQIANISSITAGSITGSQIAANTITDNNIFSVGWNKLPSGGAVGGVLVGSMPNPGFGNNVVGNGNIIVNTITGGAVGSIALNTINDSNIVLQGISYPSILLNTIHGVDGAGKGTQLALNTVGLTNLYGTATPNQIYITDGATPTTMDALTVAKILIGSVALDTNLSTTKLMPVIVNTAGNGYTTKAHDKIQYYFESNSANFASTSPTCAGGTTPTTSNTAKATNFGTSGTISFTPLSASSKVIIECDVNCGNTTSASFITVALFQGSSLLDYNCKSISQFGNTSRLKAILTPGSTSTLTFSIYIGPSANSAQINIDAGNQISSVSISEYL